MLNTNANDGTLSGAVQALSGVDISAPDGGDGNLVSFEEAANRAEGLPPPEEMAAARQRNEQPRDEAGKFKPAEAQQQAQPPAQPQQPEAQASTLEEEFFELPAEEEGGEPQRIPAKDIFDGYQRAKQLEVELENVRRVAPPPVEYDRQMYETVQERNRLVQLLDTISQTMLPEQPNMELLNGASPHYDPSAYHAQAMAYQAAHRKLQGVQQLREQQEQQLSRERDALMQAAKLREQGKLREFWPEIADPAVQRKVIDGAARHYGITTNDFASTTDSRLYAILKDALAFREAQSQRQSAVKVVRSVPKLVKAPARNTQGRGQQTYSSAMQQLQRSGSVEDAAKAIGGLLG